MIDNKHRLVAKINLNNLQHNLNEFKKLQKEGTKTCAVIKANAYGHGSVQIAKFLSDKVDYFAIASLNEGIELRENGIKNNIIILGHVGLDNIKYLLEYDIEPAVYSYELACAMDKEAKLQNKILNIHIKLDTGMSRLGFIEEDDYVNEITKISHLENLHFKGIFSHFAEADMVESKFTDLQFEKFMRMVNNLEKSGLKFDIRHIANSGGSEHPQYHLDMIRVGTGMYGHYTGSNYYNSVLNLKPVLTLSTVIAYVKLLPKEKTISYGRNYETKQEQWIGTIPVGYGDCLPRTLSNKNHEVMLEDGKKCQIVGNICMDQCMIHLDKAYEIGTPVEVFGENIGLYEMSKKASTITCEVLTSLQRRVTRQYYLDGKLVEEYNYVNDRIIC